MSQKTETQKSILFDSETLPLSVSSEHPGTHYVPGTLVITGDK